MGYYQKEKKGHGCCGGIFAFFIVIIIVLVLLLFCTNTLDSYKNKVLEFFYPTKYSEYVEKYSKEYNVDEALIYAVIKTESGFRPEVESSAGARGLMQLMPSTFELLQQYKDGTISYGEDELYNPEINIEYGTYLLSHLLKTYGNNEKTAIAAYNAGETAVSEWLSDSNYSSDGSTLTKIPYPETENYVDKVLNTRDKYIELYGIK